MFLTRLALQHTRPAKFPHNLLQKISVPYGNGHRDSLTLVFTLCQKSSIQIILSLQIHPHIGRRNPRHSCGQVVGQGAGLRLLYPLGGGNGTHGANQAAEVAAHALGADELWPAGLLVEEEGLVAAIGTGNGASATAYAL